MILLIDNYDSFVYNLARYAGRLGYERQVVRHDAVTLPDIERMAPEAIVISPGPCTPRESGISMDVIRALGHRIPILGVCLGHQCIGEAYGGRTVRATRPVHGQTSLISHSGEGLFAGLPDPLSAARYHSLIVELPENSPLEVTARLQGEDTIMAVRHAQYPVYGVQFHPESVLTEQGLDMMQNFMTLAEAWNREQAKAA